MCQFLQFTAGSTDFPCVLWTILLYVSEKCQSGFLLVLANETLDRTCYKIQIWFVRAWGCCLQETGRFFSCSQGKGFAAASCSQCSGVSKKAGRSGDWPRVKCSLNGSERKVRGVDCSEAHSMVSRGEKQLVPSVHAVSFEMLITVSGS